MEPIMDSILAEGHVCLLDVATELTWDGKQAAKAKILNSFEQRKCTGKNGRLMLWTATHPGFQSLLKENSLKHTPSAAGI
eukprot:688921-Karenia_brevis.AAC.1